MEYAETIIAATATRGDNLAASLGVVTTNSDTARVVLRVVVMGNSWRRRPRKQKGAITTTSTLTMPPLQHDHSDKTSKDDAPAPMVPERPKTTKEIQVYIAIEIVNAFLYRRHKPVVHTMIADWIKWLDKQNIKLTDQYAENTLCELGVTLENGLPSETFQNSTYIMLVQKAFEWIQSV